jgi:serine/threonine protein phosphatase 1
MKRPSVGFLPVPDQYALPEGVRVYAIGDIHGCDDLLVDLLAAIDAHLRIEPVARPIEVVLGDFIDRGPDSRGVIDRLMAAPEGRRRVVLRGNHEQWLLEALRDPRRIEGWLMEGGHQTLASFDAAPERLRRPLDAEALAAEAREKIGRERLEFVASTKLCAQIGDFLFVHAGLRPGRPLTSQAPDDLLWIREPFLSGRLDFPFMIVHGHTPANDVEVVGGRLGVDVGAYARNRLACAVIEKGRAFSLTVRR